MTPGFAVTTPMRDAETNTPPRFVVAPGSCDSHVHVFEAGYPHVAEPLYTFPEATLDQYQRVARSLGLERLVLVQPSYYGTDNRLLLDVLRRLDSTCAGVIQVDEGVRDDDLDGHHELGVRAIRLDLFARATWPIEDIVAYIHRMAALTRPRGWHLQFYSPGTVVRDLLPFLAEFEDPFVIDHMGYMLEADGLGESEFEELLGVLERGACWIKLSGPYRIAKEKPLSHVEPVGRALVEARPDRLIWGSDWPHLPNGQRDTGELLNLLADWAPSEQDRRRILIDSPSLLFFDGVTPPGSRG
jgi:2-pyrone-4,6-dicarboxylate lactonase